MMSRSNRQFLAANSPQRSAGCGGDCLAVFNETCDQFQEMAPIGPVSATLGANWKQSDTVLGPNRSFLRHNFPDNINNAPKFRPSALSACVQLRTGDTGDDVAGRTAKTWVPGTPGAHQRGWSKHDPSDSRGTQRRSARKALEKASYDQEGQASKTVSQRFCRGRRAFGTDRYRLRGVCGICRPGSGVSAVQRRRTLRVSIRRHAVDHVHGCGDSRYSANTVRSVLSSDLRPAPRVSACRICSHDGGRKRTSSKVSDGVSGVLFGRLCLIDFGKSANHSLNRQKINSCVRPLHPERVVDAVAQ